MIFALLTLLAALAVASVTEWFSVVGIMAIYAGAPFNAALIMGLVLGGAKLVTISWLYRNWKISTWVIKGPLLYFTIALMIASSIGVYGFLTKSHLEQGAATVDNSAKIERLDQQIAREKSIITDNEKVIGQLDASINSYLGNDKTDRALAVRRAQAPQRKQLKDEITSAQKSIDEYSDEKLKLTSEVRALQLEVGPIKYIADLFYGSSGNVTDKMEAAVRIFTLLIVSTLDPLAVILLIAANHTLMRIKNEKEKVPSPVFEEDNVEASEGETSITEVNNKNYKTDTEEENSTSKSNDNDIWRENHAQIKPECVEVPKMDDEIPVQESKKEQISKDETIHIIEKPKWSFNDDEVPEVPAEIFVPTKMEEMLAKVPDIEQIVAASILPEIKIDDEEEINIVEKTANTGSHVNHTQSVQPMDDLISENDTQVTTNEIVTTFSTDTAEKIPEIQEVVKSTPWAHQAGLINELVGFIPQKINEKEKQASTGQGKFNEAKETNTSITAHGSQTQEKIQEVVSIGQKEISDKDIDEVSTPIRTDRESNKNSRDYGKYPKALSWITEFKGS